MTETDSDNDQSRVTHFALLSTVRPTIDEVMVYNQLAVQSGVTQAGFVSLRPGSFCFCLESIDKCRFLGRTAAAAERPSGVV